MADERDIDQNLFGPSEIELLASSLRLNSSDLSNSMSALASVLESVSPGNCTVRRRKQGIVSKKTTIEEISLRLGDSRYTAARAGSTKGLTCTRAKVVRGIVIKTEEMDANQWVDSLAKDLASEAARSQSARDAVSRLLGLG